MGSQFLGDVICDGGDLDCGSGLLLIIKKAMDPLAAGQILEIRSREVSVGEDLPAWCRMVGQEFLGLEKNNRYTSYFVKKHADQANLDAELEAARGYRWSVRVRGQNGLTAHVYARNHSLMVGKAADFSATVEAPSSVDLLLASLGSDLVVGLKVAASQAQIELDEVECSLRANLVNVLFHLGLESGGDPSVEQIEGVIYVATTEDEATVKLIWQQVLERSPLYQTLKRGTKINLRIEITL